MKKEYEEATMELLEIGTEDIITSSGVGGGPGVDDCLLLDDM